MRNKISEDTIELLKDVNWLTNKLVNEGYSSSRLARELGTTRTTVEKYKKMYDIQQTLTPAELMNNSLAVKTEADRNAILNKRKQTNLSRYGEENTFQSHKEQIKEIMVERHGVDKALKNPDFLAKMHTTMVERYGVEHANHNDELNNKRKQTNLVTYGVENPATTERCIQKAKDTNLARYNRDHKNQTHLSIDVLNKLNDKEWLIDQHHTNEKTLSQIANELECAMTTVWSYSTNHGIETKYYYESAQQRQLCDWLIGIGINVECNVRNIIKGELDIFLPDYNIAIEYCGVFWHSDAHTRMHPNYHMEKFNQCDKKGILLITLFESSWVYYEQSVKTRLLYQLKLCPVYDIDDCIITDNIKDMDSYNSFIGEYCTNVMTNESICIYYNDQLVSVLSYHILDGIIHIEHYITNCIIQCGLYKMIEHCANKTSISSLVVNIDCTWNNEQEFMDIGFELFDVLLPAFKYTIDNHVYDTKLFTPPNCYDMLPGYDDKLSLDENIISHGYHKIWDCGYLVLKLNY